MSALSVVGLLCVGVVAAIAYVYAIRYVVRELTK